MITETVKSLKPAFDDPGFYGFKQRLRKAFPNADMIEAVEGVVTVVIDGKAVPVTA